MENVLYLGWLYGSEPAHEAFETVQIAGMWYNAGRARREGYRILKVAWLRHIEGYNG